MLRLSLPQATAYVPPLSMPGALMTTEEYGFSGGKPSGTPPAGFPDGGSAVQSA